MGSAEGVTPICSDFPVLFLICYADLRSLFWRMPRFVPTCSVFFPFVPICFQNKSGKLLSADPFCKSLIQTREIFLTPRGGISSYQSVHAALFLLSCRVCSKGLTQGDRPTPKLRLSRKSEDSAASRGIQFRNMPGSPTPHIQGNT